MYACAYGKGDVAALLLEHGEQLSYWRVQHCLSGNNRVCACPPVWEGVPQCRRVCPNVGRCAPVLEGVPQCGRVCPSVGACAPVWESVPQCERGRVESNKYLSDRMQKDITWISWEVIGYLLKYSRAYIPLWYVRQCTGTCYTMVHVSSFIVYSYCLIIAVRMACYIKCVW